MNEEAQMYIDEAEEKMKNPRRKSHSCYFAGHFRRLLRHTHSSQSGS